MRRWRRCCGPGNAGSNTAADHLLVLQHALAQLPDRWRHSDTPILIRADGAGSSHALISALTAAGLDFSVGYPVTDAVRQAISLVPSWAWQAASTADGDLREHADVVEVTGLLDLSRWATSCPDLRVIVRRELPHPGATLDAFEVRDGYRYQAFTTRTSLGSWRSWTPGTGRTPGSRTGSAPAKTPAWATCPLGTSTSTPSGSSWP